MKKTRIIVIRPHQTDLLRIGEGKAILELTSLTANGRTAITQVLLTKEQLASLVAVASKP